MSLVLKINGVDRSNHVDWESIAKVEGLTKEPDSLTFKLKKTASKTLPTLGQSVELLEDSVKIFAGTLTEKQEHVIGGILLGYNFKCKDKTHELDRKLVVKAYENESADDIVKNIVDTFTTGFTYTNVKTGAPILGTVKFNYEQPSKAIQKIADLINWDYYIDYEADIHFFDESVNTAPYTIDDTGGHLEWKTLKFDRNILELKNTVIVRGGEYKSAVSEAETIDKLIADGTQRVFLQIYRYSNINVKKNSTTLTVGIDNIDDPADFDVLYNFQEKAIKFRDDNKPAGSDTIKVWGDAHIPLITKVRDQSSIGTYGAYEHIEIRKDITSKAEAKAFGKSLLKKWAEGSSEGSFKTTKTGFKTGQQVTVNSSIFGVNQTYKINRIIGKARGSDHMEYEVFFIASGEITFTDIMIGLLSKDRQNIELADDEVLQRLEIFSENVTVAEAVAVNTTSPPYTWGVGGSNDINWNYGTWS